MTGMTGTTGRSKQDRTRQVKAGQTDLITKVDRCVDMSTEEVSILNKYSRDLDLKFDAECTRIERRSCRAGIHNQVCKKLRRALDGRQGVDFTSVGDGVYKNVRAGRENTPGGRDGWLTS